MDFFVARQAILDRQQRVYAYELLFRSGLENVYSATDGDHASSKVITDSIALIGLDTLTGGKKAFINFTRKLILDEIPTVLPKDTVVVEILEDVEPDREIIEACKKLKRAGCILALDDFVFRQDLKPLIELADIIKVDFIQANQEQRRNIPHLIGHSRAKFLAEKVETYEEFEEAAKAGYSYFQGYFFSKPAILSGTDIPGYKLNYLQILQQINQPDVDFAELEKILKRDLSLSYKLLRLINSAAFSLRKRVDSIKQALVLLGLRDVKKFLSLIALSRLNDDKPEELLINSILRSRFYELLAPMSGMGKRAPELFMLGMFSMIDAILNRPLSDILSQLPISEDVKTALLGEENPLRKVYQAALAYEKGSWEEFSVLSKGLALPAHEVPKVYFESMKWANNVLALE